MSKTRYTCADWGDADGNNTGICRDFLPSSRKAGQSEKEYREFQRRCAESAREGTGFYREQGCKRAAHMMLPYGRSGVRYGPPATTVPPQSGEAYSERLESVRTPLARRTQSSRWEVPTPKRGQEAQKDLNPRLTQQVRQLLSRAADADGFLTPAGYAQTAAPELQELVGFTPLVPARIEKLATRIQDTRKPLLHLWKAGARPGQVPEGLMSRLARGLGAFNRRFTHAAAGPNVKSAKVTVEPDPALLRLRVAVEDRNYLIPGMDTRHMRVVALNGQEEPFARLKARSQDPDVVQARRASRAERYIPYSGALLLFFFQAATAAAKEDPKGRVAVTVEDTKGRRYTFPSVSLRGLQHSDLMQAYDPSRKSYYTLNNLTDNEVAEYLLGLKPSSQKRKKRRGRNLPPLSARNNPVARPSFLDISAYRDLAPGSYRPIPSNPTYCVYRKVLKGPASTEEEFKVTTCKRAQSWQAIRPENQLARLVEETQAATLSTNPRRAPMGRRRKNFDPLAELMAEFGPTARLGKRQKRGAPNFDRRVRHPQYPGKKHGHYDPYAQTVAPYPARTSVPTNRRNPRPSMTPAQAEFAENSRKAAALMRENGMSRKQAWDVVRNNPDDTKYFRQTGDHNTGPFMQDFSSPYEIRRGAYDATGPSTPPVNRRNPSMRKMSGSQLEALSNGGDRAAARELKRREKRRAERAKTRRGRSKSRAPQPRDFYIP